MYRLFHDGEVPTGLSKLKPPKDDEFGSKGREADYFSKLRRLLAKMEPGDQKLVLHMAQKVAETSPEPFHRNEHYSAHVVLDSVSLRHETSKSSRAISPHWELLFLRYL